MITDFQVESLGVESPSSFTGYGLGPSSKFAHCCYGIGDTESEALDDCLEMMAQASDSDIDDETAARIRAAYGPADDKKTAAQYLGVEEEEDESGEEVYFHVGIKWNEG